MNVCTSYSNKKVEDCGNIIIKNKSLSQKSRKIDQPDTRCTSQSSRMFSQNTDAQNSPEQLYYDLCYRNLDDRISFKFCRKFSGTTGVEHGRFKLCWHAGVGVQYEIKLNGYYVDIKDGKIWMCDLIQEHESNKESCVEVNSILLIKSMIIYKMVTTMTQTLNNIQSPHFLSLIKIVEVY